METSKVYVGTYKKYNNGNLGGAWICLDKCNSYDDFLQKCKEAHKDEQDPEFMIQDTECMPDGLDCLEWINRQDFEDIKIAIQEASEGGSTNENEINCKIVEYSEKSFAVIGDTYPIKDTLKELGGMFNKRLSCGAGWIFSNSKREAVEKFLQGGSIVSKSVEKSNEGAEYVETLKEYADSLDAWEKEYSLKHYAAAVKVRGGFYLIKKPSIMNRFCFHDEGPDYEFYKELKADDSKMTQYFIDVNLAQIEEVETKDEYGYTIGHWWKLERCKSIYLVESDIWNSRELKDEDKATEEELEQINKAIRFVRNGFEKRLNSYLKRYGLSKIHTWTYWAEA